MLWPLSEPVRAWIGRVARCPYLGVLELPAFAYGVEQESTTAHVAAAQKFAGKQEASAEDLEQGRDVFVARDAAEKHEARGGAVRVQERAGLAQKRHRKVRICGVDGDRRPAAQPLEPHGLVEP